MAGKWFHPDHLECVECHSSLNPASVVIYHGRLSCHKHGFVYAHGCEYCQMLIAGSRVPQLLWNNKLYHLECLVCRICGMRLSAIEAKGFHNRPHCKSCYRLRMEERRIENGKHNPEVAQNRREKFRERGIVICGKPVYR
jgi:hypothetical protein